MIWVWLAATLAGGAAAMLAPAAPRLPARASRPATEGADVGWMLRWRPLWCALAGLGALAFLGGRLGLVAAPVAAVGCWWSIGRAESPIALRERESARADLPHLVRLLAAALGSGAAPAQALAVVAAALPGSAADRVAPVAARLRLGADPVTTWRGLAADAALAPLGRALARAHATGAPVAASVERLSDELARAARAEVEDRARRVGVKAAVPLGICLLPAFLLLGVVPVVAGLLTQIQL